MENQHQHQHHPEDGGYLFNTFSERLGQLADRYWPVLVITFGFAFVFGVPFHTYWR